MVTSSPRWVPDRDRENGGTPIGGERLPHSVLLWPVPKVEGAVSDPIGARLVPCAAVEAAACEDVGNQFQLTGSVEKLRLPH